MSFSKLLCRNGLSAEGVDDNNSAVGSPERDLRMVALHVGRVGSFN